MENMGSVIIYEDLNKEIGRIIIRFVTTLDASLRYEDTNLDETVSMLRTVKTLKSVSGFNFNHGCNVISLDIVDRFVNRLKTNITCNDVIAEVLEFILSLLNENDFSSFVSKIVQDMRNCDLMLSDCDFMILSCCLNVINSYLIKCNSVFQTELFYNLIIRTTLFSDDDRSKKALVKIVPKIIFMTTDGIFEKSLWNCIKEARQDENKMGIEEKDNFTLSRSLSILCTLGDHYLSGRAACPVVKTEDFWQIVYNGIINVDPVLRKQSLYLAKRAIDLLEKSSFSVHTDIFLWENELSEKLKEIWADIFIILETLEEKQVHLVTPLLPVAVKVCLNKMSSGKRLIYDVWLTGIVRRIVSHDSGAVVKWGLTNMLTINAICWSDDPHLIKSIMCAVNNSSIYSKQNEPSLDIEVPLSQWFIKSSSSTFRNKFFQKLVAVLCEITWAPVPLFYVAKALSSVPCCDCWDNNSLLCLKNFIMDALRTQIVYIRGATQCLLLRSVIQLTDVRNVTIKTLSELLSAFRRDECLMRGTETWHAVVLWIQSFVNREAADEFIRIAFELALAKNSVDRTPKKVLSRMFVLLYDANLISKELILVSSEECVFNVYFELFSNCDKRVYFDVELCDQALSLFVYILHELQTVHNNSNGLIFLNDVISEHLGGIICYIRIRLQLCKKINDIDSIALYINALACFAKYSCIKAHDTVKNIICMVENSIHVLYSTEMVTKPVKKYASVEIIHCLLQSFTHCTEIHKKIISLISVVNIEELKLNEVLVKDSEVVQKDVVDKWSKMDSKFICGKWALFSSYLSCRGFKEFQLEPESLLELGIEAIQISGGEVANYINRVFKIILPSVLNRVDIRLVHRFVTVTWGVCFELRKMDLFWLVFKHWVTMVFQEELLMNQEYRKLAVQYAEKILELGESVQGLCIILIAQLRKEIRDPELLVSLLELIIKALLFGPVHRKDLRLENNTCTYIKTQGKTLSINILKPLTMDRDDCCVRLEALNLLVGACIDVRSHGNNLHEEIINLLFTEEELISKKRRYFIDSYHHRRLNRILQAILVLEPVLRQKDLQNRLVTWSLSRLSTPGGHQPSIRYQLEWLLERCLIKDPAQLPYFWDVFEGIGASDAITSSYCSCISVAYHLAVHRKDLEFSEICLKKILPWTMAQNYNVRLYAQVALCKLYSSCPALLERHSIIKNSLENSLARGHAARGIPKLQSDFYFTVFHPDDHFSLKSIFRELPRLSCLTEEEWVSLEILQNEKMYLNEMMKAIPLEDRDGCVPLSDCQPAAWTVKPVEGVELSGDNSEASSAQKKMVPWRSMLPDNATESYSNGLLVIASLIDRPPNLGGLCRTCEVFGASGLVLNSLNYITDKQFTSVSMSSEKHVNVTEVKRHHLAGYLRALKEDAGYVLVGAEQTAGSVKLSDYKFPLKSALLLGNEKEGVPADLLSLVDVCVEVPQQGVVRSLNVHVTGAIFLWEYAKQNKMNHTNT